MKRQINLVIFLLAFINNVISQNNVIDNYNVTWNEKSKIVSDAMPLGNGTTGALVSVVENGHLWISTRHIDAWSEAHRLLKLGDLEIIFFSNPFENSFSQELVMRESAIYLKGDNGFESKIWIDANKDIIHVENNSKKKLKLQLTCTVGENIQK